MKQAKTLTVAELRRVTDSIATRAHASRNRAMLMMTHLAGLRVGEVAQLTWTDVINAEGRVREEVRLNADQTKGRHPRTVYISPKLQKELQTYASSIKQREDSAAFFYTQKHPRRGFTPNTLAQHFLNMYRAAGIDGASSHSGRRTFATSLSSRGASIRVLMKILGHRNISTTIGYVDASDDMLRRAVELV